MIYYFLLAALGLQRLNEMRLGREHLALVRENLVEPVDQKETHRMMALHLSWFACCGLEHGLRGILAPPFWFCLGIAALIGCQIVRFYSMKQLGKSWIHLPVAYHGQEIVTTGLYRYLRHPNYLAVVVEIAVVPLLGTAYITAALFSVWNALFLWKRIRKEDRQIIKIRSIA